MPSPQTPSPVPGRRLDPRIHLANTAADAVPDPIRPGQFMTYCGAGFGVLAFDRPMSSVFYALRLRRRNHRGVVRYYKARRRAPVLLITSFAEDVTCELCKAKRAERLLVGHDDALIAARWIMRARGNEQDFGELWDTTVIARWDRIGGRPGRLP